MTVNSQGAYERLRVRTHTFRTRCPLRGILHGLLCCLRGALGLQVTYRTCYVRLLELLTFRELPYEIAPRFRRPAATDQPVDRAGYLAC